MHEQTGSVGQEKAEILLKPNQKSRPLGPIVKHLILKSLHNFKHWFGTRIVSKFHI